MVSKCLRSQHSQRQVVLLVPGRPCLQNVTPSQKQRKTKQGSWGERDRFNSIRLFLSILAFTQQYRNNQMCPSFHIDLSGCYHPDQRSFLKISEPRVTYSQGHMAGEKTRDLHLRIAANALTHK